MPTPQILADIVRLLIQLLPAMALVCLVLAGVALRLEGGTTFAIGGGFALIAYPAEYGSSGVMTFLVNHAGTVYQKDLGTRTESIAKRIYLFDPDQTWKKVDVASP